MATVSSKKESTEPLTVRTLTASINTSETALAPPDCSFLAAATSGEPIALLNPVDCGDVNETVADEEEQSISRATQWSNMICLIQPNAATIFTLPIGSSIPYPFALWQIYVSLRKE